MILALNTEIIKAKLKERFKNRKISLDVLYNIKTFLKI